MSLSKDWLEQPGGAIGKQHQRSSGPVKMAVALPDFLPQGVNSRGEGEVTQEHKASHEA